MVSELLVLDVDSFLDLSSEKLGERRPPCDEFDDLRPSDVLEILCRCEDKEDLLPDVGDLLIGDLFPALRSCGSDDALLSVPRSRDRRMRGEAQSKSCDAADIRRSSKPRSSVIDEVWLVDGM